MNRFTLKPMQHFKCDFELVTCFLQRLIIMSSRLFMASNFEIPPQKTKLWIRQDHGTVAYAQSSCAPCDLHLHGSCMGYVDLSS